MVQISKVLTQGNSIAKEDSIFSRVRKNLSQHLPITKNRPDRHTCYQYNPSKDVNEKAKKVTWEYNKQHCSSSVGFSRL